MSFKQVTICKKMKFKTQKTCAGRTVKSSKKIGKLAKKMGRGGMKLKKRAMLSWLHVHKELVRE